MPKKHRGGSKKQTRIAHNKRLQNELLRQDRILIDPHKQLILEIIKGYNLIPNLWITHRQTDRCITSFIYQTNNSSQLEPVDTSESPLSVEIIEELELENTTSAPLTHEQLSYAVDIDNYFKKSLIHKE